MGSDIFSGADATLWLIVFVSVGVGVGLLLLLAIYRQFLFISRPTEVLIYSGKKHRDASGIERGYRIVGAGHRAMRIPILERVDRLDVAILPIDIVVQNAYSKGNIPLQIHAIANVKVDTDPRFVSNAVERFLGRQKSEIQFVAQQTLEGALREVLAQLTPEEVNEDRLKFADSLIHAAEDDLNKLGLRLDTLKIQHVADQTGYLDSLGRPRIAAALRDAENAENQAMQETTVAQAAASRRGEVAKAESETAVLQKKNELRRVQAELDGQAQAVEREAEAAAKTARAQAEQELQGVRRELETRRLEAEVVIPAQMNQQAREIIAKGDAAPTLQNGAASVAVLQAMTEAWQAMGPQAKELYVIQHLDELVGAVAGSLNEISVREVNVLDQGDGQALAKLAASYPHVVTEVLGALARTTGVDVPAILNRDAVAKGGQ